MRIQLLIFLSIFSMKKRRKLFSRILDAEGITSQADREDMIYTALSVRYDFKKTLKEFFDPIYTLVTILFVFIFMLSGNYTGIVIYLTIISASLFAYQLSNESQLGAITIVKLIDQYKDKYKT